MQQTFSLSSAIVPNELILSIINFRAFLRRASSYGLIFYWLFYKKDFDGLNMCSPFLVLLPVGSSVSKILVLEKEVRNEVILAD